jgi:hypothetical protein
MIGWNFGDGMNGREKRDDWRGRGRVGNFGRGRWRGNGGEVIESIQKCYVCLFTK